MDLATFDAYGNSIVALCQRIQRHDFIGESDIDAGIVEATKIEAALHYSCYPFEDLSKEVNDGIITLMEFSATERRQIAEGYLRRMEECQRVLFDTSKSEINIHSDVVSTAFKRLIELLKESWNNVALEWHNAISRVLERVQ